MKNGQLKPGYDVQTATESQLQVAVSVPPFSNRSISANKVGRKTLRFSAQLFYFGFFSDSRFCMQQGTLNFFKRAKMKITLMGCDFEPCAEGWGTPSR